MNAVAQPLPNHPTWQKLLLSAEGSIGKNWSVYEDPEPKLFEQLTADYEGDLDTLADQAMALILEAAKEGSPAGNPWAVLKEGATLFHHLRPKGYEPGDNWEHIADVLWKALEAFAQGSWPTLNSAHENNGASQDDRERYYGLGGYRNNHKLATYRLLAHH